MKDLNLKFLLTFLSIFFMVTSCNEKVSHFKKYDLTAEEYAWMEEFFTGVMLQDQAIYTLCGSKPMTRISIHYFTEEEIQAFYEQMSEEEKKNGVVCENYAIAENWEKWEKVRSKFPIKRYFFYKKDDVGDPKFASLYFVDPLKVAHTILENYMVFRNAIGFDFDPFDEAFQIEQGSDFWEEVHKNSCLIGLLYGYGLKNSSTFHWKYWGQTENCEGYTDCLTYYFGKIGGGKSTIENLTLPMFVSFFENDEVIENYKRERAKIQREYSRKDFLNHTLERLMVNESKAVQNY